MYDSYGWMLDALLYRGRDVDAAWRNPGLPIVVALLGARNASWVLPFLTTALEGVLFVYLAVALSEAFPRLPAALALALVFFTFSVQAAFDYVLADQWAVTFQTICLVHAIDALRSRRLLVRAAFFAAVSFLFQCAIVWLAPAFLVRLVELRRDQARKRETDRYALAAVAVFVITVSPWFVYKAIRFHDPFHSHVVQFPLLGIHSFGLPFYALNFAAFFGIPTALLFAAGLLSRSVRSSAERLASTSLACCTAFWVFVYGWLDPRFILYSIPMVAFPVARAVATLCRHGFFSRATPARMLLGWSGIALALLLGLYYRGHPFQRNVLPISPWSAVVFGMRPVTSWPGNVTVAFGEAKIESPRLEGVPGTVLGTRLPSLWFVANYYPTARRAGTRPDAGDLEQAARVAAGSTVSTCGALGDDPEFRTRLELALLQKPLPCGARARFALQPVDDPATCDRAAFSGAFYRLCALGAEGTAR